VAVKSDEVKVGSPVKVATFPEKDFKVNYGVAQLATMGAEIWNEQPEEVLD